MNRDGSQPGTSAGRDLTPRQAALGLVALYLLAVALRLAAKNLQALPFIFNDELGFIEAGRSVLGWHGIRYCGTPIPNPNWLYPLLIAPPLTWLDPVSSIRWVLVINALAIATTIPLAYGLARRCLDRRGALAAAGLTALMAGMSYASLVMAENVFLPLAVAAFWLCLRAMEHPSAGRRLAAGAAMGLLYHAKPQGLFFPIFFGLAVVADALTAPGWSRARRLRCVATHWLTALGWAAVVSLRFAEAAWLEGSEQPWSLRTLLGHYTGRALGDFPLHWGHLALMIACNLAVLVVACGILPALRLAVGLGPALRGHGPRRWRQLTLLTAAATLVLLVVCARHTVVADRELMVYERYLMIVFPLLFVLLLAGRPEGVAPVARRGSALAFGVLAAVAALIGVFLLARWRITFLLSDTPSLAAYWLRRTDVEGLTAARVGLGMLAVGGALLLGTLAWRGWPRFWKPGLAVMTVAWLLLGMNYGYYAAQETMLKPLTRQSRELARKIRRTVPRDASLLVLIDDLPEMLFYQIQFRCPGQAVFLKADPIFFFAKPIRLSSGGQVLSPMDQESSWLLANARWPLEGRPAARHGRYNLYNLAESPPLRMDMRRLDELLAGDAPSLPKVAPDGFPEGFGWTWMSVRTPKTWQAGDKRTVSVRVRNDSPFTLRPGDHRYAVGYHWGNPTLTGGWTAVVWDDGQYTLLPDAVAPGESVDLEVPVLAPRPAGKGWHLSLSPVLVGEHDRLWTIDSSLQKTIEMSLK